MNAVVDKKSQAAAVPTERLKPAIAAPGQAEDSPMDEESRLLLRQQEEQAIRDTLMREDRELLAQMEAEYGPIQRPCGAPVSLEGATLIVGTAVPSGWTQP